MGQSIGLCSLDILAYRMHSISFCVIVLYHLVHYGLVIVLHHLVHYEHPIVVLPP